MVLESIRHKIDLKWQGHIICAPRKVDILGNTYCIHILDSNCSCVVLFLLLPRENSRYSNVVFYGRYKCYSNNKGIFFKFSHWVNNYEKKYFIIYLCD